MAWMRVGKTEHLYDYERQAWILNGQYQTCRHPTDMACGCYGREHAGEQADADAMERMRKHWVDNSADVFIGVDPKHVRA